MKLQLMNVVVMARDYEGLRDWYADVLGLERVLEHSEHYHYAELAREGRLVVGIASADEMKTGPGAGARATLVGQLNVDDVRGFLARVDERGGTVPFGPSHDAQDDFWYGGFADPEGNVWWVVEMPAQMA